LEGGSDGGTVGCNGGTGTDGFSETEAVILIGRVEKRHVDDLDDLFDDWG